MAPYRVGMKSKCLTLPTSNTLLFTLSKKKSVCLCSVNAATKLRGRRPRLKSEGSYGRCRLCLLQR
ncbi:uncharacterized protein DS421_5g162620 [Arachis hypogaea]|nr:uncharacterized protein DS421_5g162620 [Arachis hypogaea]